MLHRSIGLTLCSVFESKAYFLPFYRQMSRLSGRGAQIPSANPDASASRRKATKAVTARGTWAE